MEGKKDLCQIKINPHGLTKPQIKSFFSKLANFGKITLLIKILLKRANFFIVKIIFFSITAINISYIYLKLSV